MSDDKTGYKKPPKKSQFKKGQSGNPSGRPKGSSEYDIIFDRVMFGNVTLTEGNGHKRNVSLFEALLTMMAKRAGSDPRAFKQIMQIYMQIKGKELGKIKEPLPWSDDDAY